MPDLEQLRILGTHSTARLGFGCSNLLGDKTRTEGLTLLHAAYDAGIRHFDVARYYGYGEAEDMVGEFAAARREEITITTKFGLQPLTVASAMQGPMQLARKLVRSFPPLRKLVQRNVHSLVKSGQFDLATARSSLDTSLKKLRTEYIDLLLLHEPKVEDCNDELLLFLENARRDGKIRGFGVGGDFNNLKALVERWPSFTTYAQFENSLVAQNLRTFEAIRPSTSLLTLTYGAFSAVDPIKQRIAADAHFAERSTQLLQVDLRNSSITAGVILRHALWRNTGGIVLFRSASSERIKANIRQVTELQLTDAQLEGLENLWNEPTGSTSPPLSL